MCAHGYDKMETSKGGASIMPRVAKRVKCSEADLIALKKIISTQKSEQRAVRRAKMVLMCIEGWQIKDIANELGERPNTVITWRDRFIELGLKGLDDLKRTGKPIIYGDEFRKLVFDKLAEKPPNGLARWDGAVLAAELDVSDDAVWRLLRKEGIQLARQRTWCVSADPAFTAKASEIVALYLAPPENAVVICVDEKPSMQALSRTTGYVRTRNGKTVTAIKSTYRRNGTQNLFAALEVATGIIHGKTTKYKKRVDFLAFMDDLLTELPTSETAEYHVILDNYSIHKRCDEWLKANPNVFFHFTPTSASWLNQVEIWFNIMTRKVLRGASFDSIEQLCEAIEKYIASYNKSAEPFIWKKREVKGTQIKDTIANLRN
jgi:transposase